MYFAGVSRIGASNLDGKRVAVIAPLGTSEAPKTEHEIMVWQNFFDYLRQRVPVK
jgi:hypothetical protein